MAKSFLKIFAILVAAGFPFQSYAAKDKNDVTQEGKENFVSGQPFSGADQVFQLGSEHGKYVRKWIIEKYCEFMECTHVNVNGNPKDE